VSESEKRMARLRDLSLRIPRAGGARPDIALGVAEKQYRNLHVAFGLPWNHRFDGISPKTEPTVGAQTATCVAFPYGIFSMRSRASALDVAAGTMWLQPSLPAGRMCSSRPVYTGSTRRREIQGNDLRTTLSPDCELPSDKAVMIRYHAHDVHTEVASVPQTKTHITKALRRKNDARPRLIQA